MICARARDKMGVYFSVGDAMLKKIGEFVFKYKGAFALALGIAFALGIVGTAFLALTPSKINSDMVSYLDEGSTTKKSLVFLREKFGIRGNATLVVRVDENDLNDVERFRTAVKNVEKMPNVSSVTWHGSLFAYDDLEAKLSETLDALRENREFFKTVMSGLKEDGLYPNADDALKILDRLGDGTESRESAVRTDDMEKYLRHETSTPGVCDCVVLILTDVDAGERAYELLREIKSEFEYAEYAATGTTETAERLLSSTMRDLPKFLIWGAVSVLVILFLTTRSFVEPGMLLLTLGVGIVTSMGMNYLFPSISVISFAISSVLQLAITMDYAIFCMHIYRKKRHELEPALATVEAFPEIAESILASAFTTMGGFAALYCMKFKIGTDVANVLVKGVFMSAITVLALQPFLAFYLDKAIQKTTHDFAGAFARRINASRTAKNKPELRFARDAATRPIAKFAVRARIALIVLAACLVAPCFLAQGKTQFSYLELYEKRNDTPEEKLANELGNQLILALPVKALPGRSNREFVEKARNVDPKRITGVLSAFTAMDIDEDTLVSLLNISDSGGAAQVAQLRKLLESEEDSAKETLEKYGIREENAQTLLGLCDAFAELDRNVDFGSIGKIFRRVGKEWHTICVISFSGNTEDAAAQKAYSSILRLCDECFGAGVAHPVGMIASSQEMNAITPRDFLTVTLVSVAIIYAIVTLLLKNPLKSLIIIVIIELGIWINLAVNYALKDSVNFIVYIIISSVQLGCTVDYAILFANAFEKNRDSFSTGKDCAVATASEAMRPIFASALMIASVCLGIFLISDNIIIRQLSGMLARGALINFALVAFLQTAIWSFFPVSRQREKYERKYRALLEESQAAESRRSNRDKPEP